MAFSAGTEATRVDLRAIRVLAEIGIDISGYRSKNMVEFAEERFDLVITLCGSANEQCPLFVGGVRRTHLGFDDLSRTVGDEKETLAEFRRVRDDMKEKLIKYLCKSA